MNNSIKAYAFWDASHNLRTGTKIIVNDDETVIGNVVMKNPGSSCPLEYTSSREDGRLRFTVDATMYAIVDLFDIKEKGGTINIYNLSDERNPDYNKAKNSLTSSDYNVLDELKTLNVPTYIGWGEMWRDERFTYKANLIFELVKEQTKGYGWHIGDTIYFHPLYLMRYGLNRNDCREVLNRFRSNFIKNEDN